MKKFISKLLTCVMAATAFSGGLVVVGCSSYMPEGTEKIDETRTQLYVYNHFGGYGSDWINAAKARYEELHKNDVYEEGKPSSNVFSVPSGPALFFGLSLDTNRSSRLLPVAVFAK